MNLNEFFGFLILAFAIIGSIEGARLHGVVGAIVGGVVGVLVGLAFRFVSNIADHVKERAHRKEKQEQVRRESVEAFNQRILNPQFQVIQEVYGKPASKALRNLYENKEEILKDCIQKVVPGTSEDRWIFVAWYEPMDREQIDKQWLKDGKHFGFANDGTGSQYVVDPTNDDAEVLYFEHETDALKPTGVTMAQFLSLEERMP